MQKDGIISRYWKHDKKIASKSIIIIICYLGHLDTIKLKGFSIDTKQKYLLMEKN